MREFETPIIEVKTIDVADEITTSDTGSVTGPAVGPNETPIK